MTTTIADKAAWLKERNLQKILGLLGCDGEEARIAGGAVRNALMGEPVSDVDIATTCLPEEVIRRAEGADLKSIPTGIKHGTVTVIANGKAFEVTTLRKDVETDGRRAKVKFGRSWQADAERRDFTINGLFADADGTVLDLVGGITDIENRIVRFIGEAEIRIREDYLRILRFFRFFAWYGSGRPDPAGLKACAALKKGLDGLSAERVWSELKKLLGAPDPSRALLWMRQTGVLSRILPETEKWGIDGIHALIAAESELGWKPDSLLRLEAILPPREERVKTVARRLKLSGAEAGRLEAWSRSEALRPEMEAHLLERQLYRDGVSGIADRLQIAIANSLFNKASGDVRAYMRLLQILRKWRKPEFPLTGKHLLELGVEPGVKMGKMLAQLECEWLELDFSPGRDELITRAREILAGPG